MPEEESNTKTLDTLIDDIHQILTGEHTCNEEFLNTFAENIKNQVQQRLETVQRFERGNLRVSKLGTPDRKLWYEMHESSNASFSPEKEGTNEGSTIDPSLLIKFMYGDLIEELVLLLVKEAGHKVEGEQGELEVEGVVGHRDCIIDGITVDVKSTSNFAFSKFQKGTLMQDDPFGYIAQISTYSYADKSEYGAFLAMNKETGQLTLLKVHPVDMIHPPTRIKHVREMVERDTPPENKCYQPEPHGKAGNMVLNRNCSYCPFKKMCWSKDANNGFGLRSFRYSNGVKDFVTVVDEPRVEEIVVE